MNNIVKLTLLASVGGFALSTAPAMSASFINGGFEDGTFNGWTYGTGYRGGIYNTLTPSDFLPNGKYNDPTLNHSTVIAKGYTDPYLGSKIGATTYGNSGYAARIEDTQIGGYASAIEQRVNNYSDPNIFFAYKAVLNGAHGASDAASLEVRLIDATSNSVIYTESVNAAAGGGGVDPQFTYDSTSNTYYNANWQVVQAPVATPGHDYLLQVLVADCEQTGHFGYVYLDGFGNSNPISTVPLPASLPMFGLGVMALGVTARVMRGRKSKAHAAA